MNKRNFDKMVTDKALARQSEIMELLLFNGFKYDDASDSAYIIYEDKQDKLVDEEIIKIAKAH